ncbi:MAG: gamma-glutamyl-gamma-aminobutyrate hydrolase family protein [Sphaerochaetaceae bacterium]
MKRPVIAISGTLGNAPENTPFKGWKRDSTNYAYTSSIVKAGGVPIMLPVVSDLSLVPYQLANADALLIPGGPDITPSLYHQEQDALCGPYDTLTDVFQLALIKEAREKGKPILGICKGCQIINVACGGSLFQDYKLRSKDSFIHNHYENACEPCHEVIIESTSRLKEIFGCDKINVNSLHHQQIHELGEGLRKVASCAYDGGIEAIESTEGPFLMGIQWHPEAMMMASSSMFALWQAFIKSAC